VLKKEFKLKTPVWVYFVIFTVSGFSGLIYESIWSHYLKLFLGHAAFAQALVLVIFMGGMALGAWLVSRYTDKIKSPIFIYVLIEFAIGIMGLLFHNVFSSLIEYFYSSFLPSVDSTTVASSSKWIVASLLILPQSIALGATFPLLTAGIIRRYSDNPGEKISTLYFANSIGAAFGVLASGFILIKAFGLPGTIATAGILNILLALIVYVVLRLDTGASSSQFSESPIELKPHSKEKLFLMVALLTGTASFIYEISWIRMLSMVLGSSTHSFELMLSAFITGLAFGGLWIRKRIDKIGVPIVFLGKVQIIMGVLAILTLPLYLLSYGWMSDVITLLNRDADGGYKAFLVFSHAIALVIMIPTTFCAGMTLPLITHILMKSESGEKSIGRVYSFNTIGAIIGVLFALYVALPIFGLKGALVIAALIDITLGFYLIQSIGFFRGVRQNFALVLISFLIVVSTVTYVQFDKSLLTSGVFRHGSVGALDNREITYYKDGVTASIGFISLKNQTGVIVTNGKPDAAINLNYESESRTEDETTMALLGSMPLAFVDNPEKVANIGFGSGMTTHTLLLDEKLKEVHTVEIEPSIIEGAKYFGKAVENAFSDTRSIIHIDDAKTFFSINNIDFDIVIAEPSNPWVSGVSSLFTKEFYDNVQNYISDDGIFVQWVQLYEFSDDLLLSILKSLNESFSDLLIYTTDSTNLLIVAKKQGKLGEPNWERLLTGKMQEELKRHKIYSSNDLDARLVSNSNSVKSLLTQLNTKLNSDYYPYLDNFASEARFKKNDSTILQDISDAPLPVLDALYGKAINFQDVSFNPHLLSSAETKIAKDAINYLSKGETEEVLDDGVLRSIDLMKYISGNCINNSSEDAQKAWVHNMSLLFPRVLAFSNPGDAEQFINTLILDSACRNVGWQDEIYDLQNLYLLLAKREYEQLGKVGVKILDYEYEYNELTSDYFSAIVLMSYLATDQINAAINFKDKYISKSESFGTRPYEVLLLGELERRKNTL